MSQSLMKRETSENNNEGRPPVSNAGNMFGPQQAFAKNVKIAHDVI